MLRRFKKRPFAACEPQVQIMPRRNAIARNDVSQLDLLIRIQAPQPADADITDRPRLNLGLVIDRSGSMAQQHKMLHARKAASYLIGQLHDEDMISLTFFDDNVETLVPSVRASERQVLLRALGKVLPGGNTALCNGWMEGAAQVAQVLHSQAINRVLLLSDGLANKGETDPTTITRHVNELSKRGISTSTLGMGDDYDEDLLQAMAEAGDGCYHFIEFPEDLTDIFNLELQGLTNTFGARVTLELDFAPGVQVLSLPNELQADECGRLKLANLVHGNPVDVLLRLQIHAGDEDRLDILSLELSWDAGGRDGDRESVQSAFSLSTAPADCLGDFPEKRQVAQAFEILQHSRSAYIHTADQLANYDIVGARRTLQQSVRHLQSLPASPEIEAELEILQDLLAHLQKGNLDRSKKLSKMLHYSHRYSRRMPRRTSRMSQSSWI